MPPHLPQSLPHLPATILRPCPPTAQACRRPCPQPRRAIIGSSTPVVCSTHQLRSEQEMKECAGAHLVHCHPWSLSPLKGRTRSFLLGARLARGGAPEEEGRGRCPQDPLYCARDSCRRRYPQYGLSAIFQRVSRMQAIFQGGRFPEPRCPRPARNASRSDAGGLLPSAAWAAQAGSRWGRPACRYAAAGLRGRSS